MIISDTDEMEILATSDIEEARDRAQDELYYIERDKRNSTVEIRVYEDEDAQLDYNEVTVYDSFRVSALFDDGATIDNDIVYDTGSDAVEAELKEAREWFADKNPVGYIITFYRNGESYKTEEVR
jgi:ribosome maturation factor RimP